ncbi:DNA primase family protein [Lacticaseibacillus jixiensis]|uniref:DNA primase family protein n=1 Tax=Lacticaseibacillus jixiensis TaxID=3231926 RepID=UPI0036F21D46
MSDLAKKMHELETYVGFPAQQYANNLKQQLTPVNVYTYPAPMDKTPAAVAKYNEELAKITPSWLDFHFNTEKGKDNEKYTVHRIVKFNTVVYAKTFLDKTPIAVFPALMNGAIYQSDLGTWRTLGKGEFRLIVESYTHHEIEKWGLYSPKDVSAVRRYIELETFNDKFRNNSPFDQNKRPELVAFANGTYNILTGKMEKSKAENYMLNTHDYSVDPKENECPETEKWLNAMMGDAYITLEQFVGYMLYRSHVPFQEFLWLYGDGGEGKSTVIRRITNVIQEENISHVKPEILADSNRRFEISNLYGKEANIMADVGKAKLKDTDIIKSVTGGDGLEAEFKGLQHFTFTNYAKLLFSSNTMPTFTDHSRGFADRVMVIKLINGDARDDPSFWDDFDFKAIDDERSQFAMKCMQEFAKALTARRFTKPDSVIQASREWIQANDHLAEFVNEYYKVTPNGDRGESAKTFFDEFKSYCISNGYDDKPTQPKLKLQLEKMGVTRKKCHMGFGDDHNNMSRYLGLKQVESFD